MDNVVGVVWPVVAILAAAVAWREAVAFERETSRTPWGWPAWLWALVAALSLFWAALLMLAAKRAGRPVASLGRGRSSTTPRSTGSARAGRAHLPRRKT